VWHLHHRKLCSGVGDFIRHLLVDLCSNNDICKPKKFAIKFLLSVVCIFCYVSCTMYDATTSRCNACIDRSWCHHTRFLCVTCSALSTVLFPSVTPTSENHKCVVSQHPTTCPQHDCAPPGTTITLHPRSLHSKCCRLKISKISSHTVCNQNFILKAVIPKTPFGIRALPRCMILLLCEPPLTIYGGGGGTRQARNG
jgi:hypothetical protein